MWSAPRGNPASARIPGGSCRTTPRRSSSGTSKASSLGPKCPCPPRTRADAGHGHADHTPGTKVSNPLDGRNASTRCSLPLLPIPRVLRTRSCRELGSLGRPPDGSRFEKGAAWRLPARRDEHALELPGVPFLQLTLEIRVRTMFSQPSSPSSRSTRSPSSRTDFQDLNMYCRIRPLVQPLPQRAVSNFFFLSFLTVLFDSVSSAGFDTR